MRDILRKHYVPLLIAILVFAFAARIWRIGEIKGYIFDEVYHTVTAKLIHRNDPMAYEWWNPPVEPNTAVDWLHPPLAKYTQALGMSVFGENSFGWRISSVIFGVLVIWVTARLALEVFNDHAVSLLAALLASLDGLLLVQSRITMNDIHVTFFILLTLLMYVQYRKSGTVHRHLYLFATGLCAGLAMASKWSGLFALATVWLLELIRFAESLFYKHKEKLQNHSFLNHPFFFGFNKLIILGLVPVAIYILSYSHMFLQGKSLVCEGDMVEQGQCYCNPNSSWWVTPLKKIAGGDGSSWEKLEARGGCKRMISHFSELNRNIIAYQTTLEATHNYQSRPYQWFLNLRPVWMYVYYENDVIANIYAQGNSLLFWIGDLAIIFSIGFLLVKLWHAYYLSNIKGELQRFQNLFKQFHLNNELGQLFLVFTAYFAVWLPWQVSPRIMFFYHYTPAVPLLCIILAYWLNKIWLSKKFGGKGSLLVLGCVALIALNFAIFYPNWTGIPVPKWFADQIYFGLPTWK